MPIDGLPSSVIPSGVDWADGLDGHPGTATPNDAIVIRPSEVYYEEDADSPEIERGEQGTIQHRFTLDYESSLIYLQGTGRGTFMIDDEGNVTKVLTSRVTKQRGGRSKLSITAESISFDSPPDQFRLEVIELNPALEKHPRYAFLPAPIRNLINQAVSAAQLISATDATNLISGISANPGPIPAGITFSGSAPEFWAIAQKAATELLLKRRIGEDTFYLPGFRVVWSQFFWLPPSENPGGYIEDPITQGGLPAYFWSLDGTEGGLNIFTEASDLNQQFYSEGISWLRQADTIDYERTWFRNTHIWIGAPFAHWDADIYSNEPSPYPPAPARPIS